MAKNGDEAYYLSLALYASTYPDRSIEDEYLKRYEGYGTIRLPLEIDAPLSKSGGLRRRYNLFVVPIEAYAASLARLEHGSTRLVRHIKASLTQAMQDKLLNYLINLEITASGFLSVEAVQNPRFNKDFQNCYHKLLKPGAYRKKITTVVDLLKDYKQLFPAGEVNEDVLANEHAEIETLIKFLNDHTIDSVTKACVVCYYVYYLHLFNDNSGFYGRYLLCKAICQRYDPYTAFSLSNLIGADKTVYEGLRSHVDDYDNYGEITWFVTYTLQTLLKSQSWVNDSVVDNVDALEA